MSRLRGQTYMSSLHSFVQKPASVRWASLIHFMMRMERYFPAFCTNRPTWTISGGGLVWTVHRHHQCLSAGLYWQIYPTGVCSAWLVSTIRVRSLWWDRLSILFLDDPVFWSNLLGFTLLLWWSNGTITTLTKRFTAGFLAVRTGLCWRPPSYKIVLYIILVSRLNGTVKYFVL